MSNPVPPVIEWVEMNNWALKDLEKTFIVPDFERRPSKEHVAEIKSAIENGTFFDTLIRGYKHKSGKIVLLDFQHRRLAFLDLFNAGKITHYNFMLALYKEQDSIAVYRSLNIGKPLSPYDHYKALAKDHPFTQKLSKVCFFYRNQDRLAFLDVLLAVVCAKTKTLKADSKLMEKHLDNLTKDDIDFALQYTTMYHELEPRVAGNRLYRSTIFRTVCRLVYETNPTQSKLRLILDIILADEDLLNITDKTTGHKDSAGFYDNLVKTLTKNKKPIGKSK